MDFFIFAHKMEESIYNRIEMIFLMIIFFAALPSKMI